MIVLTPAQAGDLRYLVALFRLTIGITHQKWALGDSIRTGRVLARKGLVEPARQRFSNRAGTWVPSRAGITYVETNFVPFDAFHVEAIERAMATLLGVQR